MYMCNRIVNNQQRDHLFIYVVNYIAITHLHDWSLYCLFTTLLHILHVRSLYWLFEFLLHILPK
jgi:hypothetical protein